MLRGPRPVLTVPGVAGAPSPVLTVPRVYGAPALSSPSHVMRGPRPVLIVPRVAGLRLSHRPTCCEALALSSPSHMLRGPRPVLIVPRVAGPPPFSPSHVLRGLTRISVPKYVRGREGLRNVGWRGRGERGFKVLGYNCSTLVGLSSSKTSRTSQIHA